jgi:flagella basal body P-ring formation protein FlgA
MRINNEKPSLYRLMYRVALGALIVTGTSAGSLDRPQSLESIRRAASAEVRTQMGGSASHAVITAGGLDPRLRLAACSAPLEASLPRASDLGAQVTVRVDCRPAGWTLYVPVSVEADLPVLVLQKPVAAGARLGADDVVADTRRVAGVFSSFVPGVEALAHQHTKRPLAAGTVILADMLAADPLVLRGQQVTLLAAVGGLEVRAPGRVLTDAAADTRVRVQNLSSQRIVEGVVESADVVRVLP